MGDRLDPCSTPVDSWWLTVSAPSTIKVIDQSVRNEHTMHTNQRGTLFCWRLSSNCMWFTVSKAPEMSKDNTVARWSLDSQTVCVCSTSRSTAASVDLLGLFPICTSGIRLCC